MPKPKITRTYGPIHFEDLDPKRFEDLVRELVYDLKEWQAIEATGRSGSDDGFDIRAYEKVNRDQEFVEEDEEESPEVVHPMDGNLWMIQGKREQEIGPSRIKDIISEVDSKNPPYGYILAASANFSKKSYDAFREGLREKGVMEFHLWGKPELEDMLHQLKNDRILFTFFGISLVSKRRSRSTEIRSILTIKNKLYRILGSDWGSVRGKPILLRDISDNFYPYKKEYENFDKNPRWKEYYVHSSHPLGIWLRKRKYYAYVDPIKKEWDISEVVNLLHKEVETEDERELMFENSQKVRKVWDFLPNTNKGYFTIDGLVQFKDMILIDEKGDIHYSFPHLYLEFSGKNGPFVAQWETFEFDDDEDRRKFHLNGEWKKIEIFPKKIDEIKNAKVHKKAIVFDESILKNFKDYDKNFVALFDIDGKYDFLNHRDIIPIYGMEDSFIQITSKFKIKAKDYIEQSQRPYWIKTGIEQQLSKKFGEEFSEDQEINVYEFKRAYKFEFERKNSKVDKSITQ